MRLFVSTVCAIVITLGCADEPIVAAPLESASAQTSGAAAQMTGAVVRTPSVVLETHVGERSSQTGGLLEPLLRALEGYGFAVRPRQIAQLLKGRVPRPGILDVGKTTDDISQQIVVGIDAYNRGRFKEAVEALKLATLQIQRNPALLVLDATNSKATFDAFVQLALAQVKLGQNVEGTETMSQLIRMSSTPVSRTAYGPQAEQFYRSVLKQTQELGRGSLAVNVNDPRAVIFLDGQYRGIAKLLLGDLIPGSHTVLVQVPSSGSRQYDIDIRADAQATLDVDWRVDSSLVVGEAWASFLFASDIERGKEAAYAVSLVRRWGNASVVLVGTTRIGGTPCVIGTLYQAGARGPRGAFVPLSDGPEGLRTLARFLFDGRVTGNLSVVSPPGGVTPVAPNDTPHAGLVTGSEIAMGAGVIIALSSGLVYVESRDRFVQPVYQRTRAVTLGAIVAGSGLFGGGAYLWMRETRSINMLRAATTATGVAGVLAGGVLYFLEADTGVPYNIRSKTPGLIVAGSGLALTGLGLWLWHRDTATTTTADRTTTPAIAWAMPTLSVDASQATLGWVGSF